MNVMSEKTPLATQATKSCRRKTSSVLMIADV